MDSRIDPKSLLRTETYYAAECESCGCYFEAHTAPRSPWWWRTFLPWNWIYTHRLRCPQCSAWAGMLELRRWAWGNREIISPQGGSGTAPPK